MSDNVIEIKKEDLCGLYNILTSYPAISKEQVQNEMQKVFGKEVFKQQNIMERVKTFEDACEVLGNDNQAVIDYYAVLAKTETKDIVAYMKLRIIAEALNEGVFLFFQKVKIATPLGYTSIQGKSGIICQTKISAVVSVGCTTMRTRMAPSSLQSRTSHSRIRTRLSALTFPLRPKNSLCMLVSNLLRFG